MDSDSSLLSAAMSALIGQPVITYEQHLRNPSVPYAPLDMEAFHKTVLVAPRPRQITVQLMTIISILPQFSIFVKDLSGNSITLPVTSSHTIDDIKRGIEPRLRIPSQEQRLIYAGRQLEGSLTLRDCGIQPNSTLHLLLRLRGGGLEGFYLPKGYFDSKYSYDFTNVRDTHLSFSRGQEEYERPCGWQRHAIKVDHKYGSVAWLGSSDAAGEWPVSYHGTGHHNALSIAEQGYKLAEGVRFAHGRGIYSTPSVATAEMYAKEFSDEGEKYKVILQNRVNPAQLTKIPKYGGYWISPGDDDIRAYGLCIKKL